MCPICRKKIKGILVAVAKGEEVHPECYEPYTLFVRAIEEAHAKTKSD